MRQLRLHERLQAANLSTEQLLASERKALRVKLERYGPQTHLDPIPLDLRSRLSPHGSEVVVAIRTADGIRRLIVPIAEDGVAKTRFE